MYELHPYFTNDGTVGLYSPQDDDIYHSTYGALSESWEKFVIPAHLREYLAAHNEVKILDICYGIGYNTKTALNVFLEEVEKKQKVKKSFLKNSEKIYINPEKKPENNPKNYQPTTPSIAAIDTDNIPSGFGTKSDKKNDEKSVDFCESCNAESKCNASLDTDNVMQWGGGKKPTCNDVVRSKNASIITSFLSKFRKNASVSYPYNCESQGLPMTQNSDTSGLEMKNRILIDAVDTDKILIGLSPFIVEKKKNNFFFGSGVFKSVICDKKNNTKNKLSQIEKMQNGQKTNNGQTVKIGTLKKEFSLKREVSIILLKMLLKNKTNCRTDCGANCESNIVDDEILQNILSEKKYAPYLSKFSLNLARFCSNRGYNYNKSKNKSTFLHNIYYQYLSRSYKSAEKLLNSAQIDLNFHPEDARNFIQSTPSTYNFVFLDAFTPSKCPALWTLDFFKVLYSKLEDDGMILTYSNSAAIRNAFLKSGFFVGKISNADTNKFTGTVAVKNKNLIECPLNEQDLDLINSKAGICYRDENLNSSNDEITENRNLESSQSDLISSSKIIKKYKGR